jgi:membrane protease YdiL (CAAX protease family)
MSGFERWAIEWPVLVALLATVIGGGLAILSYALAGPLSALFGGGARARHLAEALSRCLATTPVIVLLWRLKWLEAAGLARLGGWRSWVLVLLPLVYVALVGVYVYTGDLRADVPDRRLAGAVTLNMLAVGLFEETLFRGVVLHVLLSGWGNSRWGVVGSLILSSLLFGVLHMLNLLAGKAVREALEQGLSAMVSGLCYGALVLWAGSIWPAVALHDAVNAAVNVQVASIANYGEPAGANVRMALLALPVLGYVLVLLWAVPV